MIAEVLAIAAASTSVGVSEREFSLAVYRTSIPTGRVTFNVKNFGEDPHDLAIRGPRPLKRPRKVTPEIKPSESAKLVVTLEKPGRYELYCTLQGHAAKGMTRTIRVRRPAAQGRTARSAAGS